MRKVAPKDTLNLRALCKTLDNGGNLPPYASGGTVDSPSPSGSADDSDINPHIAIEDGEVELPRLARSVRGKRGKGISRNPAPANTRRSQRLIAKQAKD